MKVNTTRFDFEAFELSDADLAGVQGGSTIGGDQNVFPGNVFAQANYTYTTANGNNSTVSNNSSNNGTQGGFNGNSSAS